MGKLFHGPLGRVKGSIGNTTYRRIYGEANASAAYDKVLEVANPRTGNQIYQRMKLAPAQRFYESFKSVLDHSRQGIQAGEKTRRAFMSEVMKDGFKKHPYVTKGFDGLVAAPYPLSKGILPQIFATNVELLPDTPITFDVKINVPTNQTIGAISRAIIDANGGRFQEGDELTFLFVGCDDVSGNTSIPVVHWFVLDTSDQTTPDFSVNADAETDGYMLVKPVYPNDDDWGTAGAACIHSRKVGTTWQYSPAEMTMDDGYWIDWTSSDAFNAMMQSYGAAGYNKVNSNRILKQASNQPANGKISIVTGVFQPEQGEPLTVAYLAFSRSVVSGGNETTTVNTVFVSDGNIVGIDGQAVTDVTPQSIGWNGGTTPWKDEYKSQIP